MHVSFYFSIVLGTAHVSFPSLVLSQCLEDSPRPRGTQESYLGLKSI